MGLVCQAWCNGDCPFVGEAHALSEREGQDIYRRGQYEEAIEYWKKAAEAGDAGSAYRLSEEFFDAKVVKRDIGLAFKYLKQAAEKADPRALTDLASLYDYGTGVPMNRERAAQLYLQAARLGMPAAMLTLPPCWRLARVSTRIK